jgi:tritrans,polycis-undecaprenyl-diphosphate synthase [geranylgeranyl-diphosphate specific]
MTYWLSIASESLAMTWPPMERSPTALGPVLKRLDEKASSFNDHYLDYALAYGGRDEIVEVARSIAAEIRDGRLSAGGNNRADHRSEMCTAHLPSPEPDLIIRTSGEKRISGFLLWQGSYSQIVFVRTLWPDFWKIDVTRAIRTSQKRRSAQARFHRGRGGSEFSTGDGQNSLRDE